MKDIIVLGGGPSGVMAAITAKKENPSLKVCIVEKDNDLLKRILVSGNGRCNIFNEHIDKVKYNNEAYIEQHLKDFVLAKQMIVDEGLVLVNDDEGRDYPFANNSKVVQEFFKNLLVKYKIEVLLNTKINFIRRKENYFIYGDNLVLEAKKIVVAIGGISYDRNKEDYISLIDSLGVSRTELFSPSLCPIIVKEKIAKYIEGKRYKVILKAYQEDKLFFCEKGEIIFKANGLSGIVVFNLTQKINALSYKNKIVLSIDFTNGNNYSLKSRHEKIKEKSITTLSKGLYDTNLINFICLLYKINDREIELFDEIIKNTRFSYVDNYSFKDSQVTSGGVHLTCINSNYQVNENLYVIGETLNIDGASGGYNLAHALMSGLVCGKDCGK